MHKVEGRSQLFTVRIWPENTSDGAIEWRGKVQRVADGETLYFRNWSDVHDFVFGEVTAYGTAQAGNAELTNDGRGPHTARQEPQP